MSLPARDVGPRPAGRDLADLWHVARHEFGVHVRRRTFVLTTLGLPLFGVALGLLTGGMGAALGRGVTRAFEIQEVRAAAPTLRVGYVDPGGFVQREPEGLGIAYVEFDDRSTARGAVRRGEVSAVFLLPADYPDEREVVRMSSGLQARGGDVQPVMHLLRTNLWPEATANTLRDLAEPGKRVDLALDLPRYRIARGNVVAIAVPLGLGLLLYIAIFTSSSFLLQSVTTEKENRVIEILMTSARPTVLLGGKLLGLGALGLLQMATWMGAGLVVAGPISMAVLAVGGLDVGPGVLALAVAYFILGYFFFGSMMAAVGAIAPSFKESGALTFALLFPAWLPIFALQPILAEPNGTTARALSLLPPTAPMTMLLRVVGDEVPRVELAFSLGLLGVASVAVLWAAARLFAAPMVLESGLPAPRHILRALRGGAA